MIVFFQYTSFRRKKQKSDARLSFIIIADLLRFDQLWPRSEPWGLWGVVWKEGKGRRFASVGASA